VTLPARGSSDARGGPKPRIRGGYQHPEEIDPTKTRTGRLED
jgi:hypothetical protein